MAWPAGPFGPRMFEVRARAGLGRIGRLTTPHGDLETPALLPVVNASSLIVTPQEMIEEFDASILMTNAYILGRGEDRDRVLREGVHKLLGFPGPIMTDSGAFQQHVYGKVDVSNEEIVKFQAAIGADFGTALDVFSEPDQSRSRAEAAVEETLKRVEEAVANRGKMALTGTVQGGVFGDLRTRSAEGISRLPLQVQAIGGVVPLMEAYRFADLAEVIIASRRGLRPDRPIHLFGAGHPMVFGLAVLLGCDLFDSAAYAKYAYDGRMLTAWGTRRVRDLRHLACRCPACRDATPEALREDPARVARHNLHVSFQEVQRVKQAIHEGTLWEHVERRSRAHPRLLEVLRVLERHVDYLEQFEKLSDGSPFFTGPETIWRPVFHRFRQRVLRRYRSPGAKAALILPEGSRPYTRGYRRVLHELFAEADAHAVVKSPLGPVPIDLDGVYPVAQSLFPADPGVEVLEAAEAFLQAFLRKGHFKFGLLWEGRETLEELRRRAPGSATGGEDLTRARAIADYQFGPEASDALLHGNVEFATSKRTHRVRNVHANGTHVLSLRASDGLYTLKWAGGQRIHTAIASPGLRVVVETDTAPFNRQGRSVFAKFVTEADPDLRPGEEVLVVDQEDALLAVGRTLMNREEMLAFSVGPAVKVREGSDQV
ncbi:MAG: tRNA guanosine(15) transglycosylase TgtA [Thermoplasmata archaeon]